MATGLVTWRITPQAASTRILMARRKHGLFGAVARQPVQRGDSEQRNGTEQSSNTGAANGTTLHPALLGGVLTSQPFATNYAIAVLFYSVLCGPSIRRPRVVARRGASQKSCIEFAHLTNCLLGGKGIPSRRVHNRQAFTAGPSCQASDQCSDGVYTNRGSTYKRRRSSKGKCNGTENRSGRSSCTMQSPKSTCETSVCKLWKPFRNRLS